MRLSIVTSRNSKQFYILESYRTEDGKNTSRIVKKLGSYDELIKEHEDPEAWAREVVAVMNRQAQEGKQKVTVSLSPSEPIARYDACLFNGGYLFLQKLFSELHLDDICRRIAVQRSFTGDLAGILGHSVYAKILDPSLSAFAYAQTLLERPDYRQEDVRRAMDIIADEREHIQSVVYQSGRDAGGRNGGTLYYYDCMDRSFGGGQGGRSGGPGRERGSGPAAELGLFLDGDGIPLALRIRGGSAGGQKTRRTVEEQIMRDFSRARLIVCADGGSSPALERRAFGERRSLTARPVREMTVLQREWAVSGKGWHLPGRRELFDLDAVLADEKLREKSYSSTFYKEASFSEGDTEQRYIVTFSPSSMDARRSARGGRGGRDEERYDGFDAAATDLECPPEEIVRLLRRREEAALWLSGTGAGAAGGRTDARAGAGLTVGFLALLLLRSLEKKLGYKYTCERIVTGLRQMRFLRIANTGFIPAYVRDDFTDDLHEAFGFRTDCEIVPKSQMRHIISMTRKK